MRPSRPVAIGSSPAIASNEDAATTSEWYCKRGDASEIRIKDLRINFGMEYMPYGMVQANATFFFAICVLTYNLYLGLRGVALGKELGRTQVRG